MAACTTPADLRPSAGAENVSDAGDPPTAADGVPPPHVATCWAPLVDQPAPRLDAIMRAYMAYQKDPSPRKLNLGIGMYEGPGGHTTIMESVRRAQQRVWAAAANYDYLPSTGDPRFCSLMAEMVFGDRLPRPPRHVATVQTISGTGALWLALELLQRAGTTSGLVLVSQHPYANHPPIAGRLGFAVQYYRYDSIAAGGIDIVGMLEDVAAAPDASIVLVQACGHNPTGEDLSADALEALAAVCARKRHRVLIDLAYQGLVSGDLMQDALPVHIFLEPPGLDVLVAQSLAKNFGLYGQRAGALHVVCQTQAAAQRVKELASVLARTSYSNPPLEGSRISVAVLEDDELRSLWQRELTDMSQHLTQMRQVLYDHLVAVAADHDWSHLLRQRGMFWSSGLSPEVCQCLQTDHSIYVLDTGRVSISGVHPDNAERIARAIAKVLAKSPPPLPPPPSQG